MSVSLTRYEVRIVLTRSMNRLGAPLGAAWLILFLHGLDHLVLLVNPALLDLAEPTLPHHECKMINQVASSKPDLQFQGPSPYAVPNFRCLLA